MAELARFDQDKENARWFGKDSSQAGDGTCFALTLKWMQVVQLLDGPSITDSRQRMDVLRSSGLEIHSIDSVYQEELANPSKTSSKIFEQDRLVLEGVAKKKGFQLIPGNLNPFIDIPEKIGDPAFRQVIRVLRSDGLKAISCTTHMSRHKTASYSAGGTMLYFDAQDGEYRFDSDQEFEEWFIPMSKEYGLYSLTFVSILMPPLFGWTPKSATIVMPSRK